MSNHFDRDGLHLLRQRVSGPVSVRGDTAYDEQRTPWVPVVEQFLAAIVNAQTTQDSGATVRFARERNLPLGCKTRVTAVWIYPVFVDTNLRSNLLIKRALLIVGRCAVS